MKRRVQGPRIRRATVAATLCAGVLFVGCSSVAPPRYHTLMPAPSSAAPKVVAAGALAWEVLPVRVPAQVDQPQWVVRTADGSLAVLEQERWIAPLADEIRAAVTERLTQLLGSPLPAASADARNRWRVSIDVQRVDSVPSREARLDASWTLRAEDASAPVLSCRGAFVQPAVEGGYGALAKAHQQGVAQLADAIGQELKAISAGQAASCGG